MMPLEAQVKEMGEWAGLENDTTGEIAVQNWLGKKEIGKKFLLSNALKKVSGKPTGQPPGWVEYAFMFNTCDKYNTQVRQLIWPHRLGHWSQHFDKIFQTHIALNLIAIWREMHPNSDLGSTQELVKQLAIDLHAYCTTNTPQDGKW